MTITEHSSQFFYYTIILVVIIYFSTEIQTGVDFMNWFRPKITDKTLGTNVNSYIFHFIFLSVIKAKNCILYCKKVTCSFWGEIYLLFRDKNFSKNFSAEMEFHKIDPWAASFFMSLNPFVMWTAALRALSTWKTRLNYYLVSLVNCHPIRANVLQTIMFSTFYCN
jgi:hypothetical protein